VNVFLYFFYPLVRDRVRGDYQGRAGLDRFALHPTVRTEVVAAVGVSDVITDAFWKWIFEAVLLTWRLLIKAFVMGHLVGILVIKDDVDCWYGRLRKQNIQFKYKTNLGNDHLTKNELIKLVFYQLIEIFISWPKFWTLFSWSKNSINCQNGILSF